MKKSEFNNRVNEICAEVANSMGSAVMEDVHNWVGGERINNCFVYGAVCEKCMEGNLMKGERKTTFMSDLSVAEFCGGMDWVYKTVKNAMKSWADDEEYMAEFILCCNFKSWEHYGRGNLNWAKFWAIMFELVRDLVYDYYDGDEEKTHYVWEYLD